MKEIAMFLLFIGLIFIIHGVYQQKFDGLKNNVRVEYRFIPRTFYEEQLTNDSQLSLNFKPMFDKDSWIDRNVTISNPSLELDKPAKSSPSW